MSDSSETQLKRYRLFLTLFLTLIAIAPTNASSTWTSRATSQDWYGITSSSDGTKLAAVVIGGKIWTSGSDGTDSCSTSSSWLTPVVIAAFVVAGVVVLVLSIIACAWCRKCCCFKRKELAAQPGVVMMQPAYVLPK